MDTGLKFYLLDVFCGQHLATNTRDFCAEIVKSITKLPISNVLPIFSKTRHITLVIAIFRLILVYYASFHFIRRHSIGRRIPPTRHIEIDTASLLESSTFIDHYPTRSRPSLVFQVSLSL